MYEPGLRQWEWRGLFGTLSNYGARGLISNHVEHIGLWTEFHDEAIRDLHAIGTPGSHLRRDLQGGWELRGLYALSRVFDILIAPFQPVNDDPALLNWVSGAPWWTGVLPPRSALPALAREIGCAQITEEKFHPFFHEIVDVQAADDPDAAPELVSEVWPGYLVASMILVRAGVVVRAGHRVLDPGCAARSPMRWAWWRRNRVPVDLSHGWRERYQWHTDFRRDYWIDGDLHYNIDGRGYRPGPRSELADDLARHLVRFRCSTREGMTAARWPWAYSFVEEGAQ